MTLNFTRRRFLQAAGVGAAAFWTGRAAAADKAGSPHERLHVGVIGTANQAAYDWSNVAAAGAEIVALCDVDERMLGRAWNTFPRAPVYTDYRRLLDQKGIDAVIVATPDHMHALATVAALESGRHVYCEKPLTHTVAETRLVAHTAARHKRVTQMGTQIHAGDNYRRVVELIQTDAIGPVSEVHVWVGTSWGGGRDPDRPHATPPVPRGLHYDTWLGPAPYRPYHPTYLPFYWRRWWDFGGGSLADMACHYMDLPFWALHLRHPTAVAAEGPKPHPETCPDWLIVRYQYPARGKQPAVRLTWYDGGRKPDLVHQGKAPNWGSGVLFVGSKGMLLSDYNRHVLLPEKQFADYQPPKPFIAPSVGHHREWVEACKTGGPTTCNFAYAGALTEAVLLGNVAYRLGKPFTWDARVLKASEPEAERYLRKEYRKGWELKGV